MDTVYTGRGTAKDIWCRNGEYSFGFDEATLSRALELAEA